MAAFLPTAVNHTSVMSQPNTAFLSPEYYVDAYQIMLDAQASAWSYDTFLSCLIKPYFAKGVFEGEALQGFYIILSTSVAGQTDWDLIDIAVAPTAQEQGYGRMLCRDMVAWAQQQNVHSIMLEVRQSNHKAQALYANFDFKTIDTRKSYYTNYDGSKEDAVIMKWVNHEMG